MIAEFVGGPCDGESLQIEEFSPYIRREEPIPFDYEFSRFGKNFHRTFNIVVYEFCRYRGGRFYYRFKP